MNQQIERHRIDYPNAADWQVHDDKVLFVSGPMHGQFDGSGQFPDTIPFAWGLYRLRLIYSNDPKQGVFVYLWEVPPS